MAGLRIIALGAVVIFGCAATPEDGPKILGASEVIDVPQTDVERQSIGGTWLYAHAAWVEAMHASATGESFDVSESYWTYWAWFEQVSLGRSLQISTGGNWETANGIVKKYGLASEQGFISGATQAATIARQAAALSSLDDSLAHGVLSSPTSRRDRALVRREADRAWGLTPEVSAVLDRVFGADVSRTFSSATAPSDGTGSFVQRAHDFPVSFRTGPGQPLAHRTLLEAITDWRIAYYAAGDRSLQIRVQRALQDSQPVLMTWFVDFNALETRDGPLHGSFNLSTLNELGPGQQGGQATLLHDYQARLADGRVLEVGRMLDPTKPDDRTLLDASLLASTRLETLRVKNTWGTAQPARAFAAGIPTYHDLRFDYLDGPVKRCATRDDPATPMSCLTMVTPLESVVLPPGY